MGDTLTHLPSRQSVERLFETIAEALRPGGVFVATFRDYKARALDGVGRFVPVRQDELPLRRRDPALGSLLQRQADATISRLPPIESVVRDVRRLLASRVGGGDTHLQAIARTLATSARSLQRRLAAAGVSYQELLDLSRKDSAERYLTDSPLSIGEVAYLLGYSEPAAFTRAFRRWNKETPQAFRQRQRGDRLRMTVAAASGIA